MALNRIGFTIVILILFGSNLYAQTYSTIVDDKEIYSLLNYISKLNKKYSEEPFLLRKRVKIKIKPWNENYFNADENKYFYLFRNLPGDERLDTIFSANDIAYIYKQFKAQKDSVWHERFAGSKMQEKKQKKPNVYYYSIPLFSIDKQLALVYISYHCGNLCAYSAVHVYRRVGNRWELLTQTNVRMS